MAGAPPTSLAERDTRGNTGRYVTSEGEPKSLKSQGFYSLLIRRSSYYSGANTWPKGRVLFLLAIVSSLVAMRTSLLLGPQPAAQQSVQQLVPNRPDMARAARHRRAGFGTFSFSIR